MRYLEAVRHHAKSITLNYYRGSEMRERLQICATARRSVTTFSHDPFVVASRRVESRRVESRRVDRSTEISIKFQRQFSSTCSSLCITSGERSKAARCKFYFASERRPMHDTVHHSSSHVTMVRRAHESFHYSLIAAEYTDTGTTMARHGGETRKFRATGGRFRLRVAF